MPFPRWQTDPYEIRNQGGIDIPSFNLGMSGNLVIVKEKQCVNLDEYTVSSFSD